MPKYAPHTLPTDAARPNMQQERPAQTPVIRAQPNKPHPAISLGQHIRRERGMQGVRGYVAQMRTYLNEPEYKELCASMGVPNDLPLPAHAIPQAAPQQEQHKEVPPAQPQQNPANQAQMLQALSQMMSMQNGAQAGGNNGLGSLLGQFMGGGQPQQQNGGINPAMLSQLLGGGQNVNSGGGLNPMMLAQLLGNVGAK